MLVHLVPPLSMEGQDGANLGTQHRAPGGSPHQEKGPIHIYLSTVRGLFLLFSAQQVCGLLCTWMMGREL